ncbi:MAG: class I SAM-dependent methyltransferase [Chthoniobacterales bacterium]
MSLMEVLPRQSSAERSARERRRKDVELRTFRLLDEIFDQSSDTVGVRLWNGKVWPDDAPRPATLVLQHPGALAKMFSAGTEAGVAEAYIYNDFDIEGDIDMVFDLADGLLVRLGDWKEKLKLAGLLLGLPHGGPRQPSGVLPHLTGARHLPERDREAVTFHYDLSNEFYRLWLDRRMVYSCAYFESPDESLDKAQEQKLDYLCAKLRLLPGQRLLDFGCGWGGLILHAAEHFGVHGTGITLSQRQADLARERIRAKELHETVEVRVCDYRDLSKEAEKYDAAVSVGMAEHVGREQLPNYFAIARSLLRPRGVFLNHAIGEGVIPRPDNTAGSFIDRYVFPDGDIPPLPIMLGAAESAGFEIRDVENLREHYALTLRHWLRRLEARRDEALAFVSEETYRIWRLYLAGSAHGFRRGRLAVYQTLLTNLDESGSGNLPLTRRDWYA